MARKRRHRERSDAVTQPLPLATLIRPAPSFPLVLVEDRRSYHPDPYRPARQLSGHPVKPNIVQPNVNKGKRSSSTGFKSLSPRIRFAAPRETVICVRRQRRKEVLHAIKRTGKGVRRRRPRRNSFSEVSCT